MPAAPEIVEAAGLKGGVEVLDQVIAQDARRAQHDVAAARKVHIQLHSKQHGGGKQVRAAHLRHITVDEGNVLAQVIGDDHLFGVAPQHAERAARAAVVAEAAAFLNLRAHLGVALNGAGDERGEEADEQRIVQRVCFDLAASFIHIDGVAHRRKGEVA